VNRTRQLAMPWARPSDLYSSPRRLTLKLTLGEAPEEIPASVDVRVGTRRAAVKVDGGPIDRILRRFADRVQVVRVHRAAAACGRPGAGHVGFDDLEHAIGLSRTFRVDTEQACCIVDLIDALRQLETVEQASPHYVCTLPFMERAATPGPDINQAWASRHQVGAAEAMAYEPGDPAVIVAVVDTGVVFEHPELQVHLRHGLDTVELGLRDLATGIQLLGDKSNVDTDPEDEVGHGTSCAGIIGAIGERIPPGLAGESSVLPIRVLGSAQIPGRMDRIGIGAISDIDFGVKSAIDLGAKVLNLSFGTPESALDPYDPRPHEDVVRYGLARGCVMVAASGNSGRAERFLPAALDGVIAVGSVGTNGQPSAFSTTGDHVALAAPGECVVSAGLHGYQIVTGTSFAAPFVAAAAALLVSRALRKSYPLTGHDIKHLLYGSATPWRLGQGKGLGSGVLDAIAALRALDQQISRLALPGRFSR